MKLKKVHLSVTSDEAAYFSLYICIYIHYNIKKKTKNAKFFLNLVSLFSFQKSSGISTKNNNSSTEILLFYNSCYLQCIFFIQ